MAKRYAPARALDNAMAGPRKQPVQDLLAEGPGTLYPAAETRSTGSGKREGQDGWAVTIVRPLPNGVTTGGRTQVAFAVWQGAQGEAGPRKMRSAWLPIAVEAKP
jgi:DMSO reductase family type II enzyme heme b subunit